MNVWSVHLMLVGMHFEFGGGLDAFCWSRWYSSWPIVTIANHSLFLLLTSQIVDVSCQMSRHSAGSRLASLETRGCCMLWLSHFAPRPRQQFGSKSVCLGDDLCRAVVYGCPQFSKTEYEDTSRISLLIEEGLKSVMNTEQPTMIFNLSVWCNTMYQL